MSTAERLLTAQEFDDLEQPEEGGKLELDEGKLCVEMPVSFKHGEYQGRIWSALRIFATERDLGRVSLEAGYRLEVPGSRGTTVRAPDVSYVVKHRLPGDAELRAGSLSVAPSLAVEVISPSDRDGPLQRKVRQYLAAGVERVWIVRPDDGTVTVLRPGGDAHTYSGADVLSSDDAAFSSDGFRLPLAEIFGD